MDYELILEIFHSKSDLFQIVSGLNLGDALSSFDELIHGLVGAELQQNVDVSCVLEMLYRPLQSGRLEPRTGAIPRGVLVLGSHDDARFGHTQTVILAPASCPMVARRCLPIMDMTDCGP